MSINIDKILIIYEIFKLNYYFIATIIYCDNKNIQILIKNFINYFRIKHINIQYHFVQKK